MPGQNLDKPQQALHLSELYTPTITNEKMSHTQLMDETSEDSGVSLPSSQRSMRDIHVKEWVGIFILCFVNLINYMDRYTLAGILPDVQKYYDIGDDKGGLLQTSFVLSYMVFAPIFGYLGDRYSRRLIMAGGIFLWSVTTLLGSFMDNFGLFIMFRAMVGIGEASYSTIAPTIISDLFVNDIRSKMLALFCFAIPVGSGLGYIVGSTTASAMGSWQWALRVTPILGVIAVILIYTVLEDPPRGLSEGSGHLQATSWKEDVTELGKNYSYIFSTLGFTCVAFVAGALAWWGPKVIHMGIALQPGGGNISDKEVAYKFGLVAMIAGCTGVPAGSLLAQHLRPRAPTCDPLICAVGMILSSLLVYAALLAANHNAALCYFLVFLAQFCLNTTWSIVADILLYCVLPTRRSMAEGLQLLFSHAFGDAGSPYLIGVISEALKVSLHPATLTLGANAAAAALVAQASHSSLEELALAPSYQVRESEFHALQYALFITCFVELLGGVFFLINAVFIVKDRTKCEKEVKGDGEDVLCMSGRERESDAAGGSSGQRKPLVGQRRVKIV